jgi:hypothetical protein
VYPYKPPGHGIYGDGGIKKKIYFQNQKFSSQKSNKQKMLLLTFNSIIFSFFKNNFPITSNNSEHLNLIPHTRKQKTFQTKSKTHTRFTKKNHPNIPHVMSILIESYLLTC